MKHLTALQDLFQAEVDQLNLGIAPTKLYDPMHYIMQLGGKRLRPILSLMGAGIYGDPSKAMPQAMAIELFHNLSLIHDDIMDAAPLRRGKTTVHKKWDDNVGILSGDGMLVKAYQFLAQCEPAILPEVLGTFSQTALEVCEGQQYDIDFETRTKVSINEYLKMIEYKTAVLVGAAMKMGAIVANASTEDQDRCYEFGKNLGIAFQLQDDYLDAFGNPETFGKQVGGDILENKKTYLYLKAIENGSPEICNQLSKLFQDSAENLDNKVSKTLELYVKTESNLATKKAISFYTKAAFDVLEKINISSSNKQMLKAFGMELMTRDV